MEENIDRHLILKIANKITYVLNDKNNESKKNVDTCTMVKVICMKAVPSFYVGHTSGTKNMWVKQMVKAFLCHKSANKFDINETGDYVDKYMNMSDTQYLMVYCITNNDTPKSSKRNDSKSSLNDDFSCNS